MPPAWFGPPNPHSNMRPQQQHQSSQGPPPPPMQQQQQYPGHYPPASGPRMPPQNASNNGGPTPNGGAHGVTGGAHSPYTMPPTNYHQRVSPPPPMNMRGGPPPYGGVMMGGPPHTHHQHHHPVATPHGHGPPRMPPQGASNNGGHGLFQGGPPRGPPNHHMAAAAARHHASSPGMPPLMMPPSNAMRPIPNNNPGGLPPSYGQQPQQHAGPSHAMQQHMMRLHQDHQSRDNSSNSNGTAFHPASSNTEATGSGSSENAAPTISDGVTGESYNVSAHPGSNNSEQQHQNRTLPTGTPEQRGNQGTLSRSPSPSAIPPPPTHLNDNNSNNNHEQDGQSVATGGRAGASPASSLPDNNELSSGVKQQPTPGSSWNNNGPLRESRVQNMPPTRMMRTMQHPPLHAQRPHPQHPNGSSAGMSHHGYPAPYPPPQQGHPHAAGQYHPNLHHPSYMSENSMDRYQQHNMGGHPPHHQHSMQQQHQQQYPMKPMYHRQQQQQQMMMHHHHQQRVMQSPMGPQHVPQPPPPPPPRPQDKKSVKKQPAMTGPNGKKKGPDVTMDAASMLLALRTSASPSNVSAATLEEQVSQDQSEATMDNADTKKEGNTNTKNQLLQDQQQHYDMDDESMPTLTSSSSSLSASAVPPKPQCLPVGQQQQQDVPKNFPSRLALPNDEAKLNSLHCFLRSELLEIFVVERSANKSPTHSPGSSVGRVGLRCVFCAMARKRHAVSATAAEHDLNQHNLTSSSRSANIHRCDEAPMAVFYPKSIAEIYRLVTSWQRCHLRKCRNLPPDVRAKWSLLRENDKSRGKTHYWITSAKELGLLDCQSRAGGIRFAGPRSSSVVNRGLAATSSADNDSYNGGLYTVSHSNEEDSLHGMGGQSYQPYNNPHFTEGPSQKHREAAAGDVSAPSVSVVESPLKNTTTPERKVDTSHHLATPVGV